MHYPFFFFSLDTQGCPGQRNYARAPQLISSLVRLTAGTWGFATNAARLENKIWVNIVGLIGNGQMLQDLKIRNLKAICQPFPWALSNKKRLDIYCCQPISTSGVLGPISDLRGFSCIFLLFVVWFLYFILVLYFYGGRMILLRVE